MKTITLTPDASGMVDWPTLSNDKKSVVTIGSFDGMHQGHQAVIRRVAELAEQEQAFSVVVLFDPRPALVHAYAAKHDGQEPPAGTPDTQALTSVDERLRAIDAIGVDYTLIVRYTMAFAAKSYRFFLGQMVGKLGMRTLVLGSDAAMGANRAGNVKAIENLALATGVFQRRSWTFRSGADPSAGQCEAGDAVRTRRAFRPSGGGFQGRTTRMEQEASGQGSAHVELHQCALSAEPRPYQGRRRDTRPRACRGRHRGAWRGTRPHHRIPDRQSERERRRIPAGGRRVRRLAGRFGGEVRRRWRRSRGEAGRRRIAAV